MRYAMIMAGGAGKRLWPLSRIARPKQLLPLLGGKSLLQLSVERLEGTFEPGHTWIVTNDLYADQVADALPQLPRENIIGEPQGRDTANAIALGAELIAARDPEATMAVFTADHVIRPPERFAERVRLACETAEAHPDSLLTFGIRPTWPHTGLGYIHVGEELSDGVHEVMGFKEKPEHRVARQYVEGGRHFWNSGMFVWTVGAIRSALSERLSASVEALRPVGEAFARGEDIADVLAGVYPSLEKISIDYAVMEGAAKDGKVLMVELDCEWFDVGSWPALENVAELDDADNVVVADQTVLLDSFRNVIVSEDEHEHLLAVLGMDDCIIVHSPDATLVCNKSDSQRLKELVAEIDKRTKGTFV